MRQGRRALTLALALLPGLAWSGPKRLTVLVTGDNGGEISPCG
jgi:hypothetical protein